jgi:hypothetical protein
MRYTFGRSMVVKRANVFALPEHLELLFGNIYICHHILPFILFANQEFVLGSESNPATLANEPKEGDLAPNN